MLLMRCMIIEILKLFSWDNHPRLGFFNTPKTGAFQTGWMQRLSFFIIFHHLPTKSWYHLSMEQPCQDLEFFMGWMMGFFLNGILDNDPSKRVHPSVLHQSFRNHRLNNGIGWESIWIHRIYNWVHWINRLQGWWSWDKFSIMCVHAWA